MGIDGSVFALYPGFPHEMDNTLKVRFKNREEEREGERASNLLFTY